VALDEVLLEVKRLDLGAGDDHLDVRDALGEVRDLRAAVLPGLEVGAHARPQGLRLADVEDVAALIPKQVDTGFRRKLFELILEA